jgi:MoCo/4Fe-4S cofactor protein with predicted Tat translocation signal
MKNKYWQSFAELNDSKDFQKRNQDEFKEELPFEDMDSTGLLDGKTPRRDFLKYLGFSTAAATLASCKVPVRKAIPFVNKPETATPGVAKYYATTYVVDGDVLPIIAKVREGRPIKIEGNNLCSYTLGGTNARAQASVLDLYDTFRLTHPSRRNNNKFDEIPTYEQADRLVMDAMQGLGGKPIVLLTSTVVSPSTKQIISEFIGRVPGSRHVQYDAVSFNGALIANEASFGRRALPTYELDRAKVIVSIGADFLGAWPNEVENARKYSYGRKIDERNPQMSKHYQFESYLSMTGACADERFTHRPSETGSVALSLYAALGGSGAPGVNIGDAKLKEGIQKVAADLQANRGAAVVICGSNDPNVQMVVNSINQSIGANGTVLNFSQPILTKQGNDKDMADLVNQMNAGQIGGLIVYEANPAYDYFNADAFKAGLQKVNLVVSFSEKMDETTQLAHFSLPTHHFLESWGDAEPKAGYFSFLQPTISPLFKTRYYQTSLLKWAGNNTDYETYFRQFWSGRLGGQQAFDQALQDGVIEGGTARPLGIAQTGASSTARTDTTRTTGPARTDTARIAAAPAPAPQPTTGGGTYSGGNVAGAISQLSTARNAGKDEVVLYQKVSMGSGKHSGNPWLLELPDPITRASWGNYAMISLAKANELGIKIDTNYEYYPEKPVIRLNVNNKEVSLPVLIIPGMNANTIAVAVGFGRSGTFSKAAEGVGQNVFGFARFNGTTVEYDNAVTVADKTFGKEKIAQVQIHNTYDGRTEVVKETTMATFMKHPTQFTKFREDLATAYASKTGDYRKEGTLYGDHIQPGLKWGMSIDMNSCIGCHACVVACHTENNVPVVGKHEVLRFHDMHWLRIDRYFVSDDKNPDDLKAVVFQPMLCQHCDNAPCENVCPVVATTHSSEGMNQMIYNRCIGTRYCANNCPYKVRRFNWADYTGADSFGDNQRPLVADGTLDEVVMQMNDELTRMVLNPDVTVRSRGVMEKCTFCVQRTQESKLKAKVENRTLGGDEVKTACSQACPTNAISFSNVNDPQSEVARIRQDNPGRLFYVIEQLHTLPNVNYLAKIRNTEEILEIEAAH